MNTKWQVYIRGNKERSGEVIGALMDRSAENSNDLKGDSENNVYYIDINSGEISDTIIDNSNPLFRMVTTFYKEIKLTPEFQKGDILVAKLSYSSYLMVVFDSYEYDFVYERYNKSLFYASFIMRLNECIIVDENNYDFYKYSSADFKLASEKSKQKFINKLKNYGKIWNSKEKRVDEYH